MLLTPLANLIPRRFPMILYASDFSLKVSAIMMYKIGERGQPCLNPQLPLKKVVGLTFTKGVIHGLLMQVETHGIK
jgi:hypothetical protein